MPSLSGSVAYCMNLWEFLCRVQHLLGVTKQITVNCTIVYELKKAHLNFSIRLITFADICSEDVAKVLYNTDRN